MKDRSRGHSSRANKRPVSRPARVKTRHGTHFSKTRGVIGGGLFHEGGLVYRGTPYMRQSEPDW